MKGLQLGLKVALVLFSSLISISSQSPQSSDTSQLDACGKASVAFSDAAISSNYSIDAKIAYDCLIDVPFQKDDALTTVEQLRLYLHFYSAQTYFANPPTPELELNPVDLNKTLDTIESKVNNEEYPNHYEFNRDLFNLFGDYRDGHTTYSPLCYVSFIFTHKYPLISVAETPDGIPEIYTVTSISDGLEVGQKVIKINGQDSVEYLTEMANTHPELVWVDPDARFNQLLANTVSGQYDSGLFAFRSTYEVDEDLILTWEDGTTTKVEWSAYLSSTVSVDSFDSTDTFYSNVCTRTEDEIAKVLNDPEASSTKRIKRRSIKDIPHPLLKRTNVTSTHYVNATSNPPHNYTSNPPVLALDGGELALYILSDIGVIVVDAFISSNTSADTNEFTVNFSALVTEIISYLTELKITKVMIDVSGNGGGLVTLGLNFAQQLFPTADHFFGSNMRWNPALAAMLTEGVDPNGTYWGLEQYYRMDGSNFSSYQEFLGPLFKDDDYFTEIARPDIAEENIEDSGIPGSYPGPQPFDSCDIVLVSSGMCGSTCAIFAEALVEQNVRSVVFGGRPGEGPMQTVGGIKGSQILEFDYIAYWAYYFLANNTAVYDSDYIPKVQIAKTFSSSINLRNSWRKVDQDTPIEFIYTPSEYRLSYTRQMAQDQSFVWKAARDVVWNGANDISGGSVSYNSTSVSSSVSYNSSSVSYNSSSVSYNSSSVEDNTSPVTHTSSVDSVVNGDDSSLDSSPDTSSSSGIDWSSYSVGKLIWSKIYGHAANLAL